MFSPTTEHADRAIILARRILAGSDRFLSWREAGYATALDAALALVGDGGDDDAVRRAAAVIIAESLSE